MVEVKQRLTEAVELDNRFHPSWAVSSQGVESELVMDQQEAELAHPEPTEVCKLIKGVVQPIMEVINQLNLVARDLP